MLNNDIKVSVIVPIYNVEKYLSRCIESILKQTYKNIEIILVNDGSTDNSGLICDEYKLIDKRIKVVHKFNGGLSDARNIGILNATGDYYSFIDSDDWIEKNMIEVMIQNIINTNSDIAIARRFRAYDNGNKLLEDYQTYPRTKVFNSIDGLSYLMSFCGFDMSVCYKIFNKYIFECIEFPFGKTCEDSFTTYKLFANAKKIVYIDKGLYNYFYRPNSITRNSKVNETVIEATYEQLRFVNRNYAELLPEASSSYITALMSVQNEYINRNKIWNKNCFYKSEARKYLKLALKNKNISKQKKIQLIIFCFSDYLYKKLYIILKNK